MWALRLLSTSIIFSACAGLFKSDRQYQKETTQTLNRVIKLIESGNFPKAKSVFWDNGETIHCSNCYKFFFKGRYYELRQGLQYSSFKKNIMFVQNCHSKTKLRNLEKCYKSIAKKMDWYSSEFNKNEVCVGDIDLIKRVSDQESWLVLYSIKWKKYMNLYKNICEEI